MLENFLHKDFEAIFSILEVIFFCWLSVGIAVFLDLYFGIKKSKQSGQKTNSYGMRKTFEKLTFYYALLFLCFCGDDVNPLGRYFEILSIPVISIMLTIAFLFTEGLSIREKANQKQRKMVDKSIAQLMNIIIKNKDLIEELKEKTDNSIEKIEELKED